MSGRVAVATDLRDYVVAVGGLPRTAERVDHAAGAIVVVDGSNDWWDATARAVQAGAAAVLVAEPGEVPLEPVGALVDLAARSRVPIVVHRARLRQDVVAAAIAQRGGIAPRVAVAECRATAHDLPAMVRDAVGWMRELAEEPLAVAAASVGPHAGTALLRARGDGHVVGSVLVAVTSTEGTLLRVQALGEVTTEFEVDAPLGRIELATSTLEGRLVAPARHESGERAAVRRAVETVARGFRPPDLEQLLHDGGAASAVFAAAAHPLHL